MKNLVIILSVGLLLNSVSGATAQEYVAPPMGVPNGPPPMEAGSGTRGFVEVHDSGQYNPGIESSVIQNPIPVIQNPVIEGSLPGVELPSAPSSVSGQPLSEYIPEPVPSGDFQPALQPIAEGQSVDQSYDQSGDYEIQLCDPALLESTGTWLRRGFWYSEVDVLLMDRIWRRDDLTVAFQFNSSNQIDNQLSVEGGRQGAELIPRLKLGHFLFRDYKNRDHAMEFVLYGGGQWSKTGRLDAINGGTLEVNPTLTGSTFAGGQLTGGDASFRGATSMQYDYDSRFNNFEMNYHVKSRMRKDRMELEPSGQWIRRAQPSSTRSLIAGIRYFNLSEDFDWNAFGIDDDNNSATAAQSGNYRVRTDNDLIGTQLGFSWTFETARWSLGLKNKSGIYLNRTDVESSFEVTGGVTSGDNDIRVDNLSFITEGSLIGKWHLRPNFSLRAGLEIMYVSSVAHASEQLNFIPVSTSQIVANGDSTFMGGLIGFEGYW